jgi:hypothetical protein
MRVATAYAILALVGFGAGVLLVQPSSSPSSTACAYVPNVPLLAVYENRSANPDGSEVSVLSYLIAVRKDGARAMIWTDHLGSGWVQTRMVYDPAMQTRVDIHDNLGIKTTWPRQQTDPKSIIVPSCRPLVGSRAIEVLGYTALHDWHFTDSAGNSADVVDGWRIPELGCLRATTAGQTRQKDGSYARDVEDRLVWLSLTDPPDSFFAVSDQLEEVSPAEEFQRYIRAGLFSESEPVLSAWKLNDVAYWYFHDKFDRPTATRRMQQIDASQVPGQP